MTSKNATKRRPGFRFWAGVEIIAILAVAIGIYTWQTRNLLPANVESAPTLSGVLLDGSPYALSESKAEKTLVYFFAPWCRICAASSGNLNFLRKLRANNELQILLVALDWQSQAEIKKYVDDHALGMPVLLGDGAVARNWNIYAYPTYYTLDNQQRVIRRDLGYSTLAGMWLRTL